MTTLDRHTQRQRPQQRRKTASFSSSLLDSIYHETKGEEEEPKQDFSRRRDNALQVEKDISSLRRAIMIEKWMENHAKYAQNCSHCSKTAPESSSSSARAFAKQKLQKGHKLSSDETTPRCEGRFTRTKSRASKIYGDLKKEKQPISPGAKIASFLNSIFSPRNVKKPHHQAMEDWGSLRKSRSAKDSTTCSFTSKSCLSKVPPTRGKSKGSVRFGPVSAILGDQECNDLPNISSHFITENITSLQLYEENLDSQIYNQVRSITETKSNEYGFRGSFNQKGDNDVDNDDDKSCTSSDLFELDNINGIVGNGMHREELPVYGTTSLKMNQAIAIGLFL